MATDDYEASEVRTDDPAVDGLRRLGVRGVLIRMAKADQLVDLRCEMPTCYCPYGRGHFVARSSPLPDWAPSPDHYPRLKSDGGHLDPWNVRLSHMFCNREDYGWRLRIRRMLEKNMSLYEIAETLNRNNVRAPHGTGGWSASTVRRAFTS